MKILANSISDEILTDSLQQDVLDEIKETYIPFTTITQHFVEIINSKGSIVLKSNQLNNSVIPINKERLTIPIDSIKSYETINKSNSDALWDKKKYRVLYSPFIYQTETYFVIIAVPMENLDNSLGNLRLIIIISIPLMLFLASLIGWYISKGAYGPVRKMIYNTESITAENLNNRLEVNSSGDEIAHLAVTLNKMIERLENSFTSLRQFTSDVSHELRTPLTILRGQLEVALERPRESIEYEEILKGNLDEVNRLQSLVDELLILSQLESGRLNILKERISIIELLTNTVARINSLAKKKNVNIILDIKINNNNDDSFINGDSAKLQIVFFNLFENAIKYSNENTCVKCTISVNDFDNAKTITISIADEGIGIAPEVHEKIFNRFYRVDFSRTRDNSISLGLGLSIARTIVEMHNGRIYVESQITKGSTFYVVLPRQT
jgi:heavy metal sensor kinase